MSYKQTPVASHSQDPTRALCRQFADIHFATERNGRKTLTTVQGLPKKFDQKKILKVIKKKFGEFGTMVPRRGVT